MAEFHFRRHPEVVNPPLSFVGWAGELTEDEKSYAGLIIQEYNVICGDICEGDKIRDEKLNDLRQSLETAGHSIVIDTN